MSKLSILLGCIETCSDMARQGGSTLFDFHMSENAVDFHIRHHEGISTFLIEIADDGEIAARLDDEEPVVFPDLAAFISDAADHAA